MPHDPHECDEAHPPWCLLTEKRLARVEGLLETDIAGWPGQPGCASVPPK